MSYEQIPEELRRLPNWIVWRTENRVNHAGELRATKVPYNARTNKYAKSNQPSTWSTFDVARAAILRGYGGLGFCLTPPYVGVDLDGCRRDGVDEPWASEIISELASYSELSPSETGIHILVRGELPPGPRQKEMGGEHHGLGLYDATRGRYLTMTGVSLNGSTIEERTAELARIHARLFPAKPPVRAAVVDELIERAQNARDGGKFRRLWGGIWEGEYGSQSEADLALCRKLAFWTKGDAGRMDALFRQSALMREKWNRADYRDATIQKAIDQSNRIYKPGSDGPVPENAPKAGTLMSKSIAEISAEPIEWLWRNRIARGKLTLLVGNPGLGKTLLATTLASIVSSGASWPLGASAEPGSVLFLSGEDDAGDTIRPRLEAAGAELRHIHIIEGTVQGYTGDGRVSLRMFDLQRDVDALSQKLRELPDVVLVIIDPITAYLGEGIDSHKNAEVRSVLTPLISMIAERKAALVGVTHLSKAGGQEALMRVIGSIAFVAAARSAYLVASDPQDKSRRLFLPLKENLAGQSGGLAFRIEGATIESPRGPIETARIAWETEPVMMDADEALRPSEPPTDSVLGQAIEWLRWTLRESTEAQQVYARAAELGISQITIRRAADQLNIVKRKMAGKGGRWLWYLPAQGAQDDQGDQR